MKAFVCVLLLLLNPCWADSHMNWGGASGYFIWSKTDAEIEETLAAMQKADMKVLRIFITQIDADVKGGKNAAVGDVESAVGTYNDTILLKIDNLLTKCETYGVKLTIALHDRYMLGCWGKDAYFYKYGYPASPNCGVNPSKNDCSKFYSDSETMNFFKSRITHIMSHRHSGFGKKWFELDDVIFSFEPENEPQSYLHTFSSTWLCNMTTHIKSLIPSDSKILVTDGGFGPAVNPMFKANSNCPTIDVMGVHFYGGAAGLSSELPPLVKTAHEGNKRIILQEFGSSSGAQKSLDTASYIKVALANQIPWQYWELSKPGSPDEDEVWITDNTWTTVLLPQGINSTKQVTDQDWPEIWG